jgi:iron complex outermembrane receptor protein
VLALAASVAIAQEPPSAPADDQQSATAQPPPPAKPAPGLTSVEEITVTARRVEEDIQEAPVAVTAVNDIQLERLHPHDLSDLSHIAPNFNIQGNGALFRTSAIAFARGVGYNNIDGTLDPGLGISVDGVFYLRNVGVLQDMFDLEGVEIVLGPQGTLYGKNTIGGVLNVTTQKPKLGEWEANGRLRFGNLGRLDGELVANIPLTETLAARIAYQRQYSDGPYDNIHRDAGTNLKSGPEVGGDDTNTVRASLRWEPSEKFDLTTIGTWLRNDNNSVGGTNMAEPGSLAAISLGHPGFGFPGGPKSRYDVDRTWPSGDPFEMDGITIDARYHGEGFDVIALGNYLHDNTPVNWDAFDYADMLNNHAIVDHSQYSVEARVQSTYDGPLQYVGGLFYDHGFYDYWQSFYNFIPTLFGAPGPAIQNQWIFQWAYSVSVFGQVDYAVTEKLQLTAGLRYLHENKRAKNYTGFNGPTTRDLDDWPPENFAEGEKNWDKVVYKLGAKYQFTDDLMGYVSYSTGFHSGGFNSAAVAGLDVNGAPIDPNLVSATLGPWAPEEAKSTEVGIRSEWFDQRLQANLTWFWSNYDNLQSFTSLGTDPRNPTSPLPLVGPANGGEERAWGLELQAVTVPLENLRLSASVGYLDSEFTEFDTFRNGLAYDCVAQGCDPVRAPDWTLRLESLYEIATRIGTFTPVLSYSWSDSYFLDTFNDPFGHVDAYGTIDASVRWEDESGRFGVSLWAKNLADERYFQGFLHDSATPPPFPAAFATRYYADPRTYGVELTIKLGWNKE